MIYLMGAFMVYAASDFVSWRMAFYAAYRTFGSTPIPKEEAGDPKFPGLSEFRRGAYQIQNPTSELAHRLSFPVSFLRGFIEFLLPFGFGGYVLYLLLTTKL
jgi:hypothetical protein